MPSFHIFTCAQDNDLVRLKPGNYFGESSLVHDQMHRRSTATAAGSVKCFFLSRMKFLHMFSKAKLNLKFRGRVGNSEVGGGRRSLRAER